MVRFTNSNDFYHGIYYLKYCWFKTIQTGINSPKLLNDFNQDKLLNIKH